MRKIFFNLIKNRINPGSKILDAGCGTGINMKILKVLGEVHGIDSSEEAINFCKERGINNVTLASIENIPFKNNEFDLVTTFEVIYHKNVKDDLQACKEIHRVLKNKGLVFLRVPAFECLRGNHDKIVHTRERYTKKKLSKLLHEAGFSIEKITYTNTFLFPFVYGMRKLKTSGSDIEEKNSIKGKVLQKILEFEAFLLSWINFPFGVSLIAIARKNKNPDF